MDPTEYAPMRFPEPPKQAGESSEPEDGDKASEAEAVPVSQRRPSGRTSVPRQIPAVRAASSAPGGAASPLQVRTARMPHVEAAMARVAAETAAKNAPEQSVATLQGHAAETREPAVDRRRQLDRILMAVLLVIGPALAGVAGWLVSGSLRNNASAPTETTAPTSAPSPPMTSPPPATPASEPPTMTAADASAQ
jgi:hypothetical protein